MIHAAAQGYAWTVVLLQLGAVLTTKGHSKAIQLSKAMLISSAMLLSRAMSGHMVLMRLETILLHMDHVTT